MGQLLEFESPFPKLELTNCVCLEYLSPWSSYVGKFSLNLFFLVRTVLVKWDRVGSGPGDSLNKKSGAVAARRLHLGASAFWLMLLCILLCFVLLFFF